MLSPNLAQALSSGLGKYWSWTEHLDSGSLEALLCAIGEFGTRMSAAKLPVPAFHKGMGDPDRMQRALKYLLTIQSTGRVVSELAQGIGKWPDCYDLSEHVSAFSMEYRERLSRQAQTAWAQGLDEFNLGILLWMVGEYAIRTKPNDENHPPMPGPIRAALDCIIEIPYGKSLTVAEVSRYIAEREV